MRYLLALLTGLAIYAATRAEAQDMSLSAFSQGIAALLDDMDSPGFAARDAARARALERGEVDYEALMRRHEPIPWLSKAQKQQQEREGITSEPMPSIESSKPAEPIEAGKPLSVHITCLTCLPKGAQAPEMPTE